MLTISLRRQWSRPDGGACKHVLTVKLEVVVDPGVCVWEDGGGDGAERLLTARTFIPACGVILITNL